MSETQTNFEIDTDVEMWWKATKKVYGSEGVTSKIIGSGIYQDGYEYAKEVVAYKNGMEISKHVFDLPPEEIELKEAA